MHKERGYIDTLAHIQIRRGVLARAHTHTHTHTHTHAHTHTHTRAHARTDSMFTTVRLRTTGEYVSGVPNASHITSLTKQQHLQKLAITALVPSKNKTKHLHEQVVVHGVHVMLTL